MGDDAKDTDTPDYFLHNAYGQAISAKMKLQRKMNNVVLNSFIIFSLRVSISLSVKSVFVLLFLYRRYFR